MKMNDNFINMI